ncbi:MAG: hypothetical protein WCD75_11185, partial [Rhodoplanes sp.]
MHISLSARYCLSAFCSPQIRRPALALLDARPTARIVSVAPPFLLAPIPLWQAPGRASLVPAHAGHRNQLEGVFPWRTKNRQIGVDTNLERTAARYLFYYSSLSTLLLGKVPGFGQPEETPLVWTLLFLGVVLIQMEFFRGWPLRQEEKP